MTVSVYDNAYRRVGQVPNYVSCEVTWKHLDAGSGTLVVGEDDPIAAELMSAGGVPVPVVVDVGGNRWSGRVSQATLEREGPPGSGTVTATLVDEWAWLQKMLASSAGSSTAMTAAAGLPSYDRRIGPAATIAAAFINGSATRLGVPVAAVTPGSDASPLVYVNARFDTLADLLTDPLRGAGVTMPSVIWLPGDPMPSGLSLTRPTVVFSPRLPAVRPWLRWSDTMGSVHKMTVVANQPGGYRIVVGLSGDYDASTGADTKTYDQLISTTRKTVVGDWGLPEVYVDAGDITAAGSESQVRAAMELGKYQGSASASFEIADADPFVFGVDYFTGDTATVTAAGASWAETITQVTVSDDRESGLVFTPVLGDAPAAVDATELMVAAMSRVAKNLRTLQVRR